MTKPLLDQVELVGLLRAGTPLIGEKIMQVDFSYYTFDHPVNFSGAEFTDDANFDNSTFKEGANFSSVKFFGNCVSFKSAQFLKKADFSNSYFRTGVDFSFVNFSDEVDFSDTKFLGEGTTNFSEINFSATKSVDFSRAKFIADGGSDFNLTKFSNGVSFWEAVFSGKRVSFYNATFSGEDMAIFKNTIFSGDGGVDFRNTEFSGSGGVTFEKAQFSGKKGVDFSEAKFFGEGATNFSQITHSGEGEMDFHRAEFLGEKGVCFSGSEFLSEGNVYFYNTIFNKECLVRLDQIQSKNPKNIQFDNIDLSNVSFYQTNIEEFRFKKVHFGRIKSRFIEREGLADEEWEGRPSACDNYSYSHVEILYRQLKRNFEEQLNFARAGNFHYGELEMQRKQKSLWSQWTSLLLPYKLISGYGEKWKLALAWFLFFWLVFLIPNLHFIQKKGDPPEDTAIQKLLKECSGSFATCPDVEIMDSFVFTLNTMTLQKDPYFKTKNLWYARLANHFLSFVGVVIIALMLLAIRRQYKR